MACAPFAGTALVSTPLDSYEASGGSQALFEALLVLDRDWDSPDFLASNVIRRVKERHCPAIPLPRQSWLCQVGE